MSLVGQVPPSDDSLFVHPQAAANFNEKALVLSGHFGPVKIPGPSGPRPFSPDRHLAHTISANEVSDLRLTVRDPEGRELCRAWESPTGPIGLAGEHCALFRALVEQIWKAGHLRQAIGLRFIEDAVFAWLVHSYQQSASTTMTDDLLGRARAAVETREWWIPIAALHVQSELQIGPVTIKPISREMLELWRDRVLSSVQGEEERRKTLVKLEQQQQELQGLAAGTITIRAEPVRAVQIALERTEAALIALRTLAAVNLRPDRVSYCTVLGKEHIEGTSCFSVRGGTILSYREDFVRPSVPWDLSDQEVQALQMAGLAIAGALLFNDGRTEFEDSVVNALRLYARSSLETETVDRVIYIFAALESVLLKDGNEAIQQNVGERLAFYLAETAADRMRMVATLRAVYSRRSSFLHHGKAPSEDPEVKNFLRDAWMFHVKLLRSAGLFPNKREFVDSIEVTKFS